MTHHKEIKIKKASPNENAFFQYFFASRSSLVAASTEALREGGLVATSLPEVK